MLYHYHLIHRLSLTLRWSPGALKHHSHLKGSSAQRSAGTFKGSRWNPLEMVLRGTLTEEP